MRSKHYGLKAKLDTSVGVVKKTAFCIGPLAAAQCDTAVETDTRVHDSTDKYFDFKVGAFDPLNFWTGSFKGSYDKTWSGTLTTTWSYSTR